MKQYIVVLISDSSEKVKLFVEAENSAEAATKFAKEALHRGSGDKIVFVCIRNDEDENFESEYGWYRVTPPISPTWTATKA